MASRTAQEAHRRILGPKSEPGKASDYMQDVHEFVTEHPDMEIYLTVRESSQGQESRRNHDNYSFMKARCEELGIRVRGCIQVTCSGKITDSDWRSIVTKITRQARKRADRTGKTAALLAFSADRYLRNTLYKKTKPNLLPTKWEYRELKRMAHGVPLLTWLDPDTPPEKARGLQSKLGQQTKGNKGGRPKKLSRAERKDLLLPKVRQLKQDTGRGCCWIAKQVGVSSKTVWEWLKEVA